MVSSEHEASHRIFQDRPELLSPVFSILGVPLSTPDSVEVLTPDATEIRPLERRVDSVLRIRTRPDETGGLLLAIEAQGRCDKGKPVSWAYYLAYLRAKYECPVLLLVTCQDPATARWAAGPFHMGPQGWGQALVVNPLVLGPDNVPVITDPEEAAQDLALAAFSAMTHGKDPAVTGILEALAAALGSADGESFNYFYELLEIGLGDSPARMTWRKLMSMATYFPGRGTLVEESYLKGRVTERVETILMLLERRHISVPADVRDRIQACTDLGVLERWMERAFTVTTAEGLFTDE